MPRKARLDAPGVLHHIIIRGIERRPIFYSDGDRANLFERCEKLFGESTTSCYAWAFLSNHVHFLLRTGVAPLSKVMSRLLTGYATGFNKKHTRSGHLFQNRYKSVICQEERYFKELVRYIHLNPVRAGIVTDMDGLNGYPFTGHPALIGKTSCDWQDVEYTHSSFGGDAAYLQFLQDGFDQGQRPDLTGGGLVRSHAGWTPTTHRESPMKGDERILGDTSFVMGILTEAEEKLERRYAMKQAGIDLPSVEQRVTALFTVAPEDLYGRSRTRHIARARALFCFWAAKELQVSQKALADLFSMSEAAVTFAVRRGQRIAAEKGYELLEG
jgi:putative transposase